MLRPSFRVLPTPTLAALVVMVLALGVSVPTMAQMPGSVEPAASATPVLASTPRIPATPSATCDGGLVHDDGGLETGYGFVPSASWGVYLQAVDAGRLPGRQVQEVCVCWLRTRDVADFDFDLVFYDQAEGGGPAAEPYATVSSRAEGVPKGKEAGGRFYGVRVADVTLPEGVSYVGVRWDPSAAPYSFVCVDTSADSEKTQVFQREDRAKGWQDIAVSRDPIFKPHRAAMIRLRATTD